MPLLVVDLGDDAGGAGAEGVLGGGVGRPARAQRVDVVGRAVGGAAHLVERPVVGRVERPGGAVRGHAGRAGGGVDVARLLRRRAGRPGAHAHRDARGDHGTGREPDGGGGNKQPTSYLTESCPELQLPILSDW